MVSLILISGGGGQVEGMGHALRLLIGILIYHAAKVLFCHSRARGSLKRVTNDNKIKI